MSAPLQAVRQVLTAASRGRSGGRPQIVTTPRQVSAPTVYFLCPDYDRPSGGMRVMYQHAALLDATGRRARVLHQRKGFRCTWFDSDAPVTSVEEQRVGPDDVLVVSELDVDLVRRADRPVRHVVLNQSGHLTWRTDPEAIAAHYADGTGLLGVIAVSEHSVDYLRHAFPSVPVVRVRNSVDPAVFHPGAEVAPPVLRQLSRGKADSDQALQMLRSRRALDGWTPATLARQGQQGFADALRGSRVVVTTSYQEGFGLPVAEAMACGAYVVGYPAFGGRELMLPEISAAVPAGDVLALARTLETVIEHDRDKPGWCARRGAEASRFVLREYSPVRQAEDVAAAYPLLLGGAG